MTANAEDYLIDDDICGEQFGGGTLAFVNETGGDQNSQAGLYNFSDSASANDAAHLPERSDRPGPLSLRFDIVDARIEHDSHGKFVVYTIVVMQSAGWDKSLAKLDRRYSDFSALHAVLRHNFPALMRDIDFPRKQLSGNYTPETIARRSRAFEQYLSHIFAIDAVRQSSELGDFFFNADLREGYRRIENGDYVNSIPLLQSAWRLQSKLLGDTDPSAIATACGIAASFAAMEDDAVAIDHAERALDCIGTGFDRHLVPLIRLVIRLCWKLGRDKHRYEARLQELRHRGLQIDDSPSLLELVVNRFRR